MSYLNVLKTIETMLREGRIASPSYVFSEAEFKERAALVSNAFGDDIGLCFSIKANPFLPEYLPSEFSYLEVCSPGELEICKRLGIDPKTIIFSGVNKSQSDIQDAIDYGVTILTAESSAHWNYILACHKSEPVKVLLRLSDESQFGMDEEVLLDIVKSHSNTPNNSNIDRGSVQIWGLHYFTGTDKKKASEIEKEFARLTKVIGRLKEEAHYSPSHIEYGTGLGVYYFLESISEARAKEEALLNDTAKVIKNFKSEVLDPIGCELAIEMGRFFAAPCGYYITRIVDAKANDGVNYIIVDGGHHQMKYHGQLQGMKKPNITHIPEGDAFGREEAPWSICGSLCTSADVITTGYRLAEPKIGDYLVFHNTGAYSVTEGTSLFLTRDIPAAYMLTADNDIVICRQPQESIQFNCRY